MDSGFWRFQRQLQTGEVMKKTVRAAWKPRHYLLTADSWQVRSSWSYLSKTHASIGLQLFFTIIPTAFFRINRIRVFKFLTKEPLSAFQANHIGCTENGFQSIAQLVPCLTLVVGVVIEQIQWLSCLLRWLPGKHPANDSRLNAAPRYCPTPEWRVCRVTG